jgi:hypothetical protein
MAQEVIFSSARRIVPALEAIIGYRNQPVKHVQRPRIVLLSAERLPVLCCKWPAVPV